MASTSLWDPPPGAGSAGGTCWAVGPGVRAYVPSGVHRPVAAMVDVARQVQAGFGPQGSLAGRIRPRTSPSFAIRDAVGDGLELMVDCNQGWRMPWDTAPPWTLDHATEIAEALAAESVYWMEEPLHRGDYAGYAEPAGGSASGSPAR